jgi:protein-disulfide isomerase
MSDHTEEDPTDDQHSEQPPPQHNAPQETAAESASPRPRLTRLWIVPAVVVPAIAAVLIATGAGSSSPPRTASAPATTPAQRIDALLAGIPQRANALGNPTAPVTLQYFGDLQCPTSREFTLGALPFIIRKWVRAGQLRIEYRSLETATREPAVFKAQQVAALAAGMQHKLWYYIEYFYHEQGTENSDYVTEEYLQGLASQIQGLDIVKWTGDRENPELARQVATDAHAAADQGFTSTPSFLIGRTESSQPNKLLQFSVIDPAAFNVAIEKLLAAPPSRSEPQPRTRSARGPASYGRSLAAYWQPAGSHHGAAPRVAGRELAARYQLINPYQQTYITC